MLVLQPYLTALLSWFPHSLRTWLNSRFAPQASEDPLGSMPKSRLGFFRENTDACNPFFVHAVDNFANLSWPPPESSHIWGLLLPVCCRETNGGNACFARLKAFASSIEDTTCHEEREEIKIFVGIDQFDIFWDNDSTKDRVVDCFEEIGLARDSVHFHMLRSHYRGKLCRIWDVLAGMAVDAGCCFTLLVGDDVHFLSPGWKSEIEAQFADIAARRCMPFGAACVAFRDETFPVFPTFPVIHRSHFSTFGSLLPIEFVNQHGDPFLFELYRRLGTAEFASVATLENTIGGSGDARYNKHDCAWQDGMLTKAVANLLEKVHVEMPVRCLNVVVPTFRCDVHILRRITALLASDENTSVHFVVVVDNPTSTNAQEMDELQDWSPNHTVQLLRNQGNLGASASRNAGIAASCGDWIILLDDDIIPDPFLLDAYLGAIRRHPSAKILVGLTSLPPPASLAQNALVACQMTFFYDVALRMKNPPWGVTANLCIQGRTTERVIWFSDDYPRTGGGEDVDFCLRIKDLLPLRSRTEAVVAVPEARVSHPFWPNITKQVIGWALGDVLCLTALPSKTFYALPNWFEFLFLCFTGVCLAADWRSALFWHAKLTAAVVAMEIVLLGCVALPNTTSMFTWRRVSIALASSFPIMAQDIVRLFSKLRRLKLTHICLQLDWMDSQREHVGATRFASMLKCGAFSLLAVALAYPAKRVPICAALLLFVKLWSESQYFSTRCAARAHVLSGIPGLPLEFSPGDAQPFVVLAFQRTGSNLLCGKLHNHPEVVMHNEVLNNAKIWTYQNEDVRADTTWRWDICSRDANPLAFFDDLFHRKPLTKKGWRAVGFKLFPDHFTPKNDCILKQLLADPRVKKVILRRNNYLDVYVSKLRADKSGKYIAQPLDDIRVHVNPEAFDKFIDHYDECFEFYELATHGQKVQRVTYEELTNDGDDDTIQGVLRFLGVDGTFAPRSLNVTQKQTKQHLSQGIVNYVELEEAFRHHPKCGGLFGS